MTFTYRIYYEDTDAGGVVYYANYLKFAERARTDYLRSLGLIQTELAEKDDLLFVVRKVNVDLRAPARLDDEVTVSVQVKACKGASIIMQQDIMRYDQLLVRLEVTIVTIDHRFNVKRLPEKIRALLS